MARRSERDPGGVLREAQTERLTFTREAAPFGAPHVVEMVLAAAGDVRPARIQTTLDGELQADIGGIIRSYRDTLRKHGAANVAVVVLDNVSGDATDKGKSEEVS